MARALTRRPLGVQGQGGSLPQLTCVLSWFSLRRTCVLLALGGSACWVLSSVQRERPLAADDLRSVQACLLGLAREFLVRSASPEDMQALLSFLAAVGDDGQVGWRLVMVRLE